MLEPKPRLCHALPLARVLPAHPAALCPFCLQTRPTPPHLTSAMAENILAAACESETRKAAKRMRLEIYQSSQVRDHAGCSKGQRPLLIPRVPAAGVPSEVGGQSPHSLRLTVLWWGRKDGERQVPGEVRGVGVGGGVGAGGVSH